MTEALHLGGERQLFVDDFCIGELRGVRRRFHPAKKHPANPLLLPREPWEATYIQLYGNALYDSDLQQFRMWYSARYAPDGRGSSLNTVCHAASTDGIHWERTRLDRLEHKGLLLSNAVLKGTVIGPTVFHTPADPDPGRRYRMLAYTGSEMMNRTDRKAGFAAQYCVFFSPDGYAWTPSADNPAIQGGDIATCMYDPVTKDYIAFPKIHKADDGWNRRCVGVSASRDFVTWGTPEIHLSADAVDDARVEARLARFRDMLIYDDPSYYHADLYGMTGFRYADLRLGLVWLYDISAARPLELGGNDDGVINVQLAYSRDPDPYGIWRRAGDREDFLSCGDDGGYDSGMVFTAHTVVERPDEVWFYYSGVTRSHGYWDAHEPHQPLTRNPARPQSLNLATLRRDGFASIEALYPGGSMTTKLLRSAGERLLLNADAAHGEIRVGLSDHEGRPLPGFTQEECVPVCRDDLRAEVRWGSGHNLAALQGRPLRITFHLRTARLYSFAVC